MDCSPLVKSFNQQQKQYDYKWRKTFNVDNDY